MNRTIGAISKAATKIRRKHVSRQIFDSHLGIVQRGPFKGLKLGHASNVSQGSLALKILGLYETPVVEEIAATAPFAAMVNFGAADGYMALGPLFAGFCTRSIGFEMQKSGRDALVRNATENNLSKHVDVRGMVDQNIVQNLRSLDLAFNDLVLLCDIEGAEFDVFSVELLDLLSGAKIIIELHDRLLPEGTNLRKNLVEKIGNDRPYKIIRCHGQDISGINDLDNLHDLDRALVTSEGRKVYGEWLVIEPRTEN